jgi:hypothetical protein
MNEHIGIPCRSFTTSSGRLLPIVGSRISWGTLGGDYFEGVVVEMDSNVAHVQLDDGSIRTVEC